MLPRAHLVDTSNMSTLTLTHSVMEHLETEDDFCTSKAHKSSRYRWKSKWDCFIAILAFMIDGRSVLHLMTCCLNYGGSAYLIARITTLLCIGFPLLLFEKVIGHASELHPLKFFGSLRPIFSGVGLALGINSIYKSLYDVSLTVWSVTKIIEMTIGPGVEGFNETEQTTDYMTVNEFTHLEAIEVIGLSISWITVVITTICGLRIISKISYVCTILPSAMLIILVIKMMYGNSGACISGLLAVLEPNWDHFLSIPFWIHAIIDTIISLNVGYGVIMTIMSWSEDGINLFKSSIIITAVHSVILSIMLLFSGSAYGLISAKFNETPTEISMNMMSDGLEQSLSTTWLFVFYCMIFLLNVDGLIVITNMLAFSLSTPRWRPVLVVIVGAILYVSGLPLASMVKEQYKDALAIYTIDLVPVTGIFCMVVAAISSIQAVNFGALFELEAKMKLHFLGRSHVFVYYASILPSIILMCIIYLLVQLSYLEGSNWFVILGWSLLCVPWVLTIATPIFVALCHFRHISHSRRLLETCDKCDSQQWISKFRPEDDSSIYELPDRYFARHTSTDFYSNSIMVTGNVAVSSA